MVLTIDLIDGSTKSIVLTENKKNNKRKFGRPTKKRTYSCSICGVINHRKRQCPFFRAESSHLPINFPDKRKAFQEIKDNNAETFAKVNWDHCYMDDKTSTAPIDTSTIDCNPAAEIEVSASIKQPKYSTIFNGPTTILSKQKSHTDDTSLHQNLCTTVAKEKIIVECPDNDITKAVNDDMRASRWKIDPKEIGQRPETDDCIRESDHIADANEERLWMQRCNICNELFHFRSAFRQHYRSHRYVDIDANRGLERSKKYRCSICKRYCLNVAMLNAHIRIHHEILKRDNRPFWWTASYNNNNTKKTLNKPAPVIRGSSTTESAKRRNKRKQDYDVIDAIGVKTHFLEDFAVKGTNVTNKPTSETELCPPVSKAVLVTVKCTDVSKKSKLDAVPTAISQRSARLPEATPCTHVSQTDSSTMQCTSLSKHSTSKAIQNVSSRRLQDVTTCSNGKKTLLFTIRCTNLSKKSMLKLAPTVISQSPTRLADTLSFTSVNKIVSSTVQCPTVSKKSMPKVDSTVKSLSQACFADTTIPCTSVNKSDSSAVQCPIVSKTTMPKVVSTSRSLRPSHFTDTNCTSTCKTYSTQIPQIPTCNIPMIKKPNKTYNEKNSREFIRKWCIPSISHNTRDYPLQATLSIAVSKSTPLTKSSQYLPSKKTTLSPSTTISDNHTNQYQINNFNQSNIQHNSNSKRSTFKRPIFSNMFNSKSSTTTSLSSTTKSFPRKSNSKEITSCTTSSNDVYISNHRASSEKRSVVTQTTTIDLNQAMTTKQASNSRSATEGPETLRDNNEDTSDSSTLSRRKNRHPKKRKLKQDHPLSPFKELIKTEQLQSIDRDDPLRPSLHQQPLIPTPCIPIQNKATSSSKNTMNQDNPSLSDSLIPNVLIPNIHVMSAPVGNKTIYPVITGVYSGTVLLNAANHQSNGRLMANHVVRPPIQRY